MLRLLPTIQSGGPKVRSRGRCPPCLGAAILIAGLATPELARAIELQASPHTPSVVGEAYTFSVEASGATGAVVYEWRFGDGDYEPGEAEATHVFDSAGLHSVNVLATDENGDLAGVSFRHLVHHPLTERRPTSSTTIIYDAARGRVYTVNPDNDTVTAIDASSLENLGELEVYDKPESIALTPTGKLWVVHQDDYAVAVVDPDAFTIESGFRLPYASQPVGVAMSPLGDAAYISLMATGKVLKLDPATGETLGEADVGPRPRGIAVSHDGQDVYVTRFISPNAGGEVVKVATDTMTSAQTILLPIDTETVDSDLQARGLPNYLFSVALTPDGRQAWVAAKKDNIVRGQLLDGLELTHDTTVRPIASIIDTAEDQEIVASRVDLDNRSMPFHVEFTPYGNLAILSLPGSNRIEVRDVMLPEQVFSAIGDVGRFPRASVLTPDNRLFVHAALSRSVLVYDLSLMVESFDQSAPMLIGEVPVVKNEKLAPEVLEGKRIFHDAEDTRMAFEGYLSCGACHFEGIEDGRVYDFTTRGEGLRNTVSLLGRRGTGHGALNWTGNLDEIQDFEHQIRDFFDGLGFLSEEAFSGGTVGDPLGDPKAGLSPELDALAAYVASFDTVNRSPYRNPDGSLTAEGVAGRAVFKRLGCDVCHGGSDFTDSNRGSLHDVGTLTALSGTRAGEPLFGFDTPTLLGVWETPPYLHDGSAATLRDVVTQNNPEELHGFVRVLDEAEVDQLVSYLLQIDSEAPVREFPFDPPFEGGAGGAAGAPIGGAAGAGASGESGGTGGTTSQPDQSGGAASCACRLAGAAAVSATPGHPFLWVLLGSAWWWYTRRRQHRRETNARTPGTEEGWA